MRYLAMRARQKRGQCPLGQCPIFYIDGFVFEVIDWHLEHKLGVALKAYINCMPFRTYTHTRRRFLINSVDSTWCDDKWRCRPQRMLECSMFKCIISILKDSFFSLQRSQNEEENERELEKNAPHPNHFTIMANLFLCVCCTYRILMAKMMMISDLYWRLFWSSFDVILNTHTNSTYTEWNEHTMWLSTSRLNHI